MVIVKPIQFTIVSAVPFDSISLFWATKVENRGESEITAIPQIIKKAIKTIFELLIKIKGDIKQHKQEINKEKTAVCFSPISSDMLPPRTQAIEPIPIITNESSGMLKVTS